MAEIGVFMVGGRRTGKTTILTSMKKGIDKAIKGSNIVVTLPGGEGSAELSNCEIFLNDYFNNSKKGFFSADYGRTKDKSKYEFCVKRAGGKNADAITLAFTDVPGEWFEDGLHDDEIEEVFNESQVFIIAVDTPSLMEDPVGENKIGKRHLENNRVSMITEYFKSNLTDDENRMILFVPLKCEKYYHNTFDEFVNPQKINYMKNIADKIEKGYEELLSFLSSDNLKNKCTVAIMPILSVGGFDFFEFEEDAVKGITGQIFAMIDNNPTYSPEFCEQPMVWTLSFVLKEWKRMMNEQNNNTASSTKKVSIWAKIRSFFGMKTQTVQEIDATINTNILMRDENLGVRIINNPMGI